MSSKKRKSISLIFIIICLLLLITLVIFLLTIFDKNQNSNNTTENITTNNSILNEVAQNDSTQSEYTAIDNFEGFETIDSSSASEEIASDSNATIDTPLNTEDESTPENSIKITDHTYILPDSLNYSKIINSFSEEELLLKYEDFKFEMTYGTSAKSFESLKLESSLKSYLETNFDITISGDIKTGNLKNLDIIACVISEESTKAYFIITPLNNSEIIYTKIYNTSDKSTLLEDLSQPLDEIVKMTSYLQD